jgi:hypothetical protein
MLRIASQCRRAPEQVIARAAAYFGPDGEGLEETGRSPCCISFEGLGGHVSVTVSEDEGGSAVEVVTQEFEYHARRFLESL